MLFSIPAFVLLKVMFSTPIRALSVVSINPFGKKDTDRLRIEFGANATYDDTNALLKNQFKFSTNFKL